MEGWRETKTTTNIQTVTSDGGYGYMQTSLYFRSDNKYSVYYLQNYRFIVRWKVTATILSNFHNEGRTDQKHFVFSSAQNGGLGGPSVFSVEKKIVLQVESENQDDKSTKYKK